VTRSALIAGRVVIVTGAGRGVGRGIALLAATEGAKVVVNDLGTSASGVGGDVSVAQQVVNEIRAAGGEAVANTESVGTGMPRTGWCSRPARPLGEWMRW